MGSALWAGISGLNASSKELDVIANNLANTNTIGFKSNTTFFADVLSQSISGGASGTMQVGRGVGVSEVQTQFGAGSFETTGVSTDVAIDGDGFFMVNNADNATLYTRAGAFRLNNTGYLVDTAGNTVQGKVVVNGEATGALGDINLSDVQSSPQVTTTFSIGVNLNSATTAGSQYNTTQTVYDSLGAIHTLNTTFTKTESEGIGYWSVQCFLDADPVTTISADGFIFDADGICQGMYTATSSVGQSEHDTVGDVTTASTASTATLGVLTGGVTGAAGITVDQTTNITASSNLVCSWDHATGLWSIANADYPAATATEVGGVVSVDLDGVGGADFHFTPTTTASTAGVPTVDTVGVTASSAITVDQEANITASSNVVCSWDHATGLWSIANADYPAATATEVGGVVSVDLDGVGGADFHFTPTTTASTAGAPTVDTVGVTASSAITVDQEANITASSNVVCSWDHATGLWSIANADYPAATATEVGGVVSVDLDGVGGADFHFTPTTTASTAGVPTVDTVGVTASSAITVDQEANITASSNIVCSYDGIGTWSAASADYPAATATEVGGVVSIDLDGVGGADLSFTPTLGAGAGTVSFAVTAGPDGTVTCPLTAGPNGTVTCPLTAGPAGTVSFALANLAGTATAVLDRPTIVTQDSTMTLTCDDISANSWSITDKGLYPNARILSANATTVNIDLDNDGVTDLHLDLQGTWADTNTATFTLTHDATEASTETVTLDRPGMVYQNGTLKLTRGATAWTIEDNGGYANATITSSGTAGPITISLDGTGTTDVTLTLDGTWDTGETAIFSLAKTELALNDVTVNFSGALDGGATIGNANGDINWNLVGTGSLNLTQYSTSSVIRSLTSDGYASGNLKSLSISSDGKISGFFTNGQTSDLAQLMIAQFSNPWGLKKMGGNLFAETVSSGAAIQNYPGQSGMGTLTSNTLEMSNTDIATEFIKMITAQKAYQASAKVVTTENDMMQVLMNIKQ